MPRTGGTNAMAARRGTARSSAVPRDDGPSGLADKALRWFDGAARELPWRAPGTTAWGVLVSEVMLQQTPVARVRPVYEAWLSRWPEPADLAAEPAGEAIRAWGRLGYPRRALRLHACASEVTRRHDGVVPSDVAELLTLPGVGAYTARAVAAFAYGRREPVVDTNVRRLAARVLLGRADGGAATTAVDLARVAALLPASAERAARVSAAFMELGALVCTARTPACDACPLRADCAWLATGRPPAPVQRPGQRYAGTDRQARGVMLALCREHVDGVPEEVLLEAWLDPAQARRALEGLVIDGLIVPDNGRFGLPGLIGRG